ncbi:hypothetical protein F5887DRAFT_1172082, partial [Amanita rubescens]
AFRHGKHIELSNLPLTATPGDLRSAIDRVGLKGVQDFALLYTSFRPTGTALISLKGPDTLKENLRLLDNALMSGIPLKAQPLMLNDADTMLPRARGDKGREEAATRGALRGDGPHAGISNGGKNVTIWGFPGKTGAASVEYIVRDFNLDRKKSGLASVYKIQPHQEDFSMYSRFLIQLTSVSEAQRLIREVHMTYFEPETLGNKFMLRARIIH